MEACNVLESLIQKYEGVLMGLEGQSVETLDVFKTRAKLAFLKGWKQGIENEVVEGH